MPRMEGDAVDMHPGYSIAAPNGSYPRALSTIDKRGGGGSDVGDFTGKARRLTAPLLIVWHSRTGAARALAHAAHAAAGDAARLIAAADATPANLLGAGGYLFVGPENLGALSGAMKELFDRCYYPLLGRVEGRPYATVIAAGSAGQGAEAQLDRIVTGWRLRRVADGVIVNLGAQTPEAILAEKAVPPAALAQAGELGAALAEGLVQGIF